MTYSFVRHINPAFAGYRGLGDYASDYAAYQADHARWLSEQQAYTAAHAAWASAVASIQGQYNASLQYYTGDLNRWNAEAQAYPGKVASRAASIASQKVALMATSKQVAQKWALSLPKDYPGCVTQAWHDEWVQKCDEWHRHNIQGLGAAPTSWGQVCGLVELPVCPPAPPMPTMRAKPVAPVKPALPPEPKLRAEPKAPIAPPVPVPVRSATTPPPPPPVVVTTPSAVTPVPPPLPESPPPAPEPARNANIMKGGLIALVVLGGGYALYRTFKKPKAKS